MFGSPISNIDDSLEGATLPGYRSNSPRSRQFSDPVSPFTKSVRDKFVDFFEERQVVKKKLYRRVIYSGLLICGIGVTVGFIGLVTWYVFQSIYALYDGNCYWSMELFRCSDACH